MLRICFLKLGQPQHCVVEALPVEQTISSPLCHLVLFLTVAFTLTVSEAALGSHGDVVRLTGPVVGLWPKLG